MCWSEKPEMTEHNRPDTQHWRVAQRKVFRGRAEAALGLALLVQAQPLQQHTQ
jgi:hypothetical protein